MERIRIQRKKKGMTMKELGKAVGVTEAAISHYETGKREPDNAILMAIASTLGVSVDFLLGRDEEQNEPAVESELHSAAHSLLDQMPEQAIRDIIQFMEFKKSQNK